ncbi:PefC/AfrB family outer membrane usher protein [Photobacterium damselae]|uniref:PefC/AfrB family outer membrane usher protein n=1 Tax=Photobacterium damselae TaxID=38293 RepID=UPI0030C6A2AE
MLPLIIISQYVWAKSELDLSFIQGDNVKIPSILTQNSGNIPGDYLVDVFLNQENMGRQKLLITKADNQSICLSKSWLEQLNLPIDYLKLSSSFNDRRQCYILDKIQGGKVVFDYSTQSIKLSLPQIALLDGRKEKKWDYGTTGFRLNYSVNGSKFDGKNSNNSSSTLYGNVDLNANFDQWVLSINGSGMSDNGFHASDISLSTAIQEIRGDLILGQSTTRSTIIPDFTFKGISVRSNSAMVPWSERGYAPVIDGIANSNARITIKQGNYILLSEVVPAGPYSLKDISPVTNGDIIVTVEEENGHKTTRIYPVATLPTLLRDGDFNYNFASGIRDDSSTNGIFGLASVDYGMRLGTFNGAAIVHERYQSLGGGLTYPLGDFGAMSASVNMSWSRYNKGLPHANNKNTQSGIAATIQYAKDFGQDTNLQLLTYRYTGEGYEDFNEFDPSHLYDNDERRSRYEAILTQDFSDVYLSASGWLQDYRDGRPSDSGAMVSLSSNFLKGTNVSLTGSYTNNGQTGDQYNIGMNMSILFDLWERSQFISSSLSYDSDMGTSFNTGTSVSISDRISTSLNASKTRNNYTSSLYAGMSFDAAQTGLSLSQSKQGTSISASASGSIAAAKGTSLVFSRTQNDTIAIANIEGIKDAKFNGSSPTNYYGNTIIPLSSYQDNSIVIDTNNIPEDIELLNSNYKVVPTNKAIIVRDFKYTKVNRFIFKLVDKCDKPLPMGTQVSTDNGSPVGFVANGGVLVATILSKPEKIKIEGYKGKSCIIDISKIKPGTNKMTTLVCNDI